MQFDLTLIAMLILGPLLFGTLILTGLRGQIRNLFVSVAAIMVMAAAVMLATGGVRTVTLPSLITTAGSVLEPVMILTMLAIGFAIRSWPVRLMAGTQLVLCAIGMGLYRAPHPEETLLVIDHLSMVMVLIVSVVGSLIVLYALGYMAKHEHHAPPSAAPTHRFFFFLIAFLGLMNGLVLVDNLKWLAVFWEGTTLCSFFLIGHDGTPEAKASARQALTLNAFGGLAMTVAGFLTARSVGSESLTALMSSGGIALLPLALLALATMTKSAQLPFQSWLLGAMVAPTPVSALLHSSTMVKAGSYLILRMSPAMAESALGTTVAVAGAFTFAVASALAIGQSNGKKVLAYSTIANLGLIATCAGIHTPIAFAAALTILIYHAISKALLFLCVGTIEQTIGSRHIDDMGGILFKMPLTTNVAIIGMASMMVPPFGMLIGKWMAIESSVHQPLILLLVAAGSALTIFFWAKWLGRITTASYHQSYKIESVSPWMSGVLVTMALGVLTACLSAVPLYHIVIKPISLTVFGKTASGESLTLLDSVDQFLAWPLFVVLGALLLAGLTSALFFKRTHLRQPYLCGENVPDGAFSFEFRSIADKPDMALLNSYYLSPIFGEAKITAWCNPVAVLIILTLFGVLFI
jgi:ech hydrogenase subunit A